MWNVSGSTKKLILVLVVLSVSTISLIFSRSLSLICHPWSEVICSGESGTNVHWSGSISLTKFIKPGYISVGSEYGFPSILNSTFDSIQSDEIL